MEKGVKEYLGSIVLGLNDALVELTGVLAGLTLALQNSRIIIISGFITGTAASLSMAASEYLSTKAEATNSTKKNPIFKKTRNCCILYRICLYFNCFIFIIPLSNFK